MKDQLFKAIDNHREAIIEMGTDIFRNPELGYKEEKTAEKILSVIKTCTSKVADKISVTGIKGTLGEMGINIGLIAEMDGISTAGHPYASEDHEAAHACGHSNQVAIMLGVVEALKETKILEKIGGRVTFIGTPAEEFVDLEFRRTLQASGAIDYLSGKQDMISKGVFDDVDLIISCHSMGGIVERKADVNTSLNGFISKKIVYHGKAAHAGAQPHLGINALNAAIIGLTAVNAQRETFVDEYNVRVHGIITDGGQSVNSVPERVVIEAFVRGRTLEAITDANRKVTRAFKAGAYAVGGTCSVEDTVGYMPFKQCQSLSKILKGNLATFIEEAHILDGQKSMASGDIGDLASILPTIQFGFGGFSGNIHGADFKIVDEEMAYIIPAKAIAGTVVDLLKENGALGKKIIEEHRTVLTKESYIEQWLKNGEMTVED